MCYKPVEAIGAADMHQAENSRTQLMHGKTFANSSVVLSSSQLYVLSIHIT